MSSYKGGSMEKCKGMVDLLPEYVRKLRYLEQIFYATCSQKGFNEVRTPTIEYLHLYTASGLLTPEMLSGVYSFLDWDGWSGERVVLRPDSTIPIMRVFLENFQNREIGRFFYIQNVFRFESTGKETRERWQCGAELIGDAQPRADVEVILLAYEVLSKLGLKPITVQISHVGVLKAILSEAGIADSEQISILEQIAKGQQEVLAKALAASSQLRELAPLINITGKSPEVIKNIKAVVAYPKIAPHLTNLEHIVEVLSQKECNYDIKLNSGIRFEYYTGSTFEFYIGERRVGGGGRYDQLASLIGGKEYPAVGFALEIDPILTAMGNLERKPKQSLPLKRLSAKGR